VCGWEAGDRRSGVGETTATRNNDSSRLYLYKVVVKKYSVVRREHVDARGLTTRQDTRDRRRA
jgi:hypothetical protein